MLRAMPTVRFHPLDLEVEVPPGTNLLVAARRAGAPLAASCDGDGICARCGVRVLSGAVGREGSLERQSKEANGVSAALRLACLVPVRADLVVTTPYW